MKISQSALQLGYEHQKNTTQAQLTNRNVRILDNNPANAGGTSTSRAGITQTQQQTLTDSISSHSQSLVTNSETGEAQYFESAEFLEAVSAVFVEEEMAVVAVQALDSNRTNQATAQIEVTSISQFESDTHIQASALGTVKTEGGREIDFLLELNYDRNIKTTQESTFTGQRDLIDPLVINLNGGAPSLSSQYFEFDLGSDGTKETLNQTAHGTGFLALDKNGNGEIDNGQELFGPNSNSGFGELAQYDDDDNGWIDENDAIFSQLSYMDFDENGEQRVRSISEVGLGALYLGSEQMDLDLFDANGNFQANIARNGVALKENGQAVSLQEIHYEDQAIGKAQMESAQGIQLGTGNALTPIESPLTVFQFDDEVINGRDADTHVRLEREITEGLISVDGIRMRFNSGLVASPVADTDSSASASSSIDVRESLEMQASQVISQQVSLSYNGELTSENNSAQNTVNFQRREEIQGIFQARFESGFTITPTNISSSSHQDSRPKIDVPTLSQSVFWQDERQSYQAKYDGGSKLDQLKQLVSDLKEMREQQKESQEKIGIYEQVSKHS